MRFLFLLILLTNLAQADQLSDLCQVKNGKLYTKYRCPKSKLKLPIRTCEYENEFGDLQFVNGCSGPSGGHKKVFFSACIKHDLCYHHEPSSGGLSRKDCDQVFLQIATSSSNTDPRVKNKKKCRSWAKRMYGALRIIGGPAYQCSDRPANY